MPERKPLISRAKIKEFFESFIIAFKLFKLVWPSEKGLIIANFILVIIPACIPFISSYIFKLQIDLVVESYASGVFNYDRFYGLLAVMLAVVLITRVAFSYQTYVSRMLYLKLPLTLYQLILGKIASLDMQHFEDSSFRDTLQRVGDSYSQRTLNLIFFFSFFIQSLVQVVIALVVIVMLNPFFGILLTALAFPDFYVQVRYRKMGWGIWNKNTPYRKKYQYLSNLIQRVEAIKELRIFQTSGHFLKEIHHLQLQFYREGRDNLQKMVRANLSVGFLEAIVLVALGGYIVLNAFMRRITVGDINFYYQVIQNYNNGVGGLLRNLSNVFEDSLYVKSIFELMAIKPSIVQVPGAAKIDFTRAPRIEFRHVSFHYPGSSEKIFNNFSLVIEPGEKIALVGENGAGKTTLIKLLARFYDVTEGEILIDGKNIKEIDLSSWYKTIGILFQDFVKYEYPVKDNVYFGRVWEKEHLEDIIEATRHAGADKMVKKFDQGLDQMLGKTFEGGIELSGGQWQKVALSRGFYRNAPILILDEPTSAIDARAESEIFAKVEKLSKDKTVIIISHRFSTVRNADRIYVIEKGRIKEFGSHQDLMKLDGQYAQLFRLQAKGYQ